MRHPLIAVALSILSLQVCTAVAEDKVPLETPQPAAPATQPAAGTSLIQQLKDMPDGVLRVRSNADGTFKSLVVKGTVEVEDVLGGQKGKRLGRREAEIQCKRSLSQWLSDNCVFAEGQNKTIVITTKGESNKDAAGNTVKLRKQEGTEVKVVTENYASVSAACLQGLIVLQSEVTGGDNPEYVLIMGLSQDTLAQSKAVHEALTAAATPTAKSAAGAAADKPISDKPAPSGDDKPVPEVKTNPDAKNF